MRKAIPSMLVTMFILIGSFHSALAAPYWVRPGVYIEYIAKRYDPYFPLVVGARPEQIHTAEIFIKINGTIFEVYANNDTRVIFKFLSVQNGYLTVETRIEMENVTIVSMGLKNSTFPEFWDRNEVISTSIEPSHDAGFLDCQWLKVKLGHLTLSGKYLIRLSDGAVFDMEGRYYGHTALWVDPSRLPESNETFFKFGSVVSKVYNVSPIDQKMMTYFREFGPPLIGISRTLEGFNVTQELGDGRKFTLLELHVQGPAIYGIYDPSSGLCLYPSTWVLTLLPDFGAIGIVFAVFTDELSAYRVQKEHSKLWGSGLVLYRTNIGATETEKVSFSGEGTPLEYAFCASLILLGVILITREVNEWAGLKRS
ncbi:MULTISPECIES: hypothetical protein [Thermococcus]|uniref:hypothetical protein n=1 Tax=Thermococcus TaxID=2263 RepID=UPI0014302052|nr:MULTISPECIES: hypothetical protein [Thermococcus]NJE48176.1 hypothetical protein [Thermococcus sp. 9N3]CAI1493393.1 conserved exported protein of unknown function [Thermococcus nautili]